MRGAGKTTCARLLAPRVAASFLDVDAEVERRAGMGVAALFTRHGEEAFRALERQVMGEVLGQDGLVVATGGGCVLDEGVRAALAASRRAVWLVAAVEVLAQRVRGSARPSLTGAPPDLELDTVLARRAPLYRACSAATVATDTGTPEDAVEALERLWWAPAPS
jgi:shikimate kinase